MQWAKDSSPLDDLEPIPAGGDEPEAGQRLPRSSRKRIYGVLCLTASASGRRTPGRLRVLAAYRARLGISPQDAEVAETLAGHLKGVRVGKRRPEQDAVMQALVELVTADDRPPTARERQLLERIGARCGWDTPRIDAALQARLEPAEEDGFEVLDDDDESGTGELFEAPAPSRRAPASPARPSQADEDTFGASLSAPALASSPFGEEDPFGASLSAPALTSSPFGDEDPFGASLSAPALGTSREDDDPFGGSLPGVAPRALAPLAPPPGGVPRCDSLDPDADFDPGALGRALSADLDDRPVGMPDPFAGAEDPFANDPFADDPFAASQAPPRNRASESAPVVFEEGESDTGAVDPYDDDFDAPAGPADSGSLGPLRLDHSGEVSRTGR